MPVLLLLSLVSCLLFFPVSNYSAALSANDFLAPAAAPDAQTEHTAMAIQKPEAVKEEKGLGDAQAVSAATAQDAVNAAIKRIDVGGGCEQIKFPSGFGWVSTGTAVYGVTANPTANLVAQRNAYQAAFLNAKKNLASALNGLSTKARDELNHQFKTIISDSDTLTNMDDRLAENVTEQVNGLLRGYVLYSVNDQQTDSTGTVTVTIVTTPKTMGKEQKIGSANITAQSVKEGLNSVLAEISSGLLPPVGGKIINVPQTNELAFIGFGSAIIPENSNPAVQAKLVLNAEKVAQMRARSALVGCILGDNISAVSSLDSATQTLSKQFEESQKDDPLNQTQDAELIQKLNEQRNIFVNTQLTRERISSMREGNLPPGVTMKTFLNPDKTIAESVAVYMPSVSAEAGAAAKKMRNSQINRQGMMPPRGSSDQVMQDENL